MGSVHTITEQGQALIASAVGSQLGPAAQREKTRVTNLVAPACYERGCRLAHTAGHLLPISVLRDHSKMREVSHRTETLRVGFQLIESFTHLINHGIKRGKSEIGELFFA
jgi:hypothetical protein